MRGYDPFAGFRLENIKRPSQARRAYLRKRYGAGGGTSTSKYVPKEMSLQIHEILREWVKHDPDILYIPFYEAVALLMEEGLLVRSQNKLKLVK